jgi:hypothetical protein
MPILPSHEEIDHIDTGENSVVLTFDGKDDVFEEASFRVWSTIVNNDFEDGIWAPNLVAVSPGDVGPSPTNTRNSSPWVSVASTSSGVVSAGKPFLQPTPYSKGEVRRVQFSISCDVGF